MRTAGPASLMALAEPTKRPAPMTPAIEIMVMWRGLRLVPRVPSGESGRAVWSSAEARSVIGAPPFCVPGVRRGPGDAVGVPTAHANETTRFAKRHLNIRRRTGTEHRRLRTAWELRCTIFCCQSDGSEYWV